VSEIRHQPHTEHRLVASWVADMAQRNCGPVPQAAMLAGAPHRCYRPWRDALRAGFAAYCAGLRLDFRKRVLQALRDRRHW
jgi:hypothetical protein